MKDWNVYSVTTIFSFSYTNRKKCLEIIHGREKTFL